MNRYCEGPAESPNTDALADFCRQLSQPLETVVHLLYVAAHESSDPAISHRLVKLAHEKLKDLVAIVTSHC